jgi:hypothetical protein
VEFQNSQNKFFIQEFLTRSGEYSFIKIIHFNNALIILKGVVNHDCPTFLLLGIDIITYFN